MKSTDAVSQATRPSIFASPPFVELREMYFHGLQADRTHLVRLAAKLARCKGRPTAIFSEIRMAAHRMHGAAAIFEVPMVSDAAGELEDAARVAVSFQADSCDPRVFDALETLVDCLARIGGNNTA